MMEFSFGFLFGAAIGWCAWLNRKTLQRARQEGETPRMKWGPAIGFIAFVIFMDYVFREILPHGIRNADGSMSVVLRYSLQVAFSFIFFGAITLILGNFSQHAAWQAAITLTVCRAVLDYTRDLNNTDEFGYILSVAWQHVIMTVASVSVGCLACRFLRGPNAIARELLLALWACYLVGCARSFGHKDFVMPPEGKSMLSFVFEDHVGIIFVHGVFTVSAVVATWFILTWLWDKQERETA